MLARILRNTKGDRIIWSVILLIALFSLLEVYSAAGNPVLASRGTPESYLLKHFLLLSAGFTLMYFVHRMDYRIFAKLSNILLYAAIPLLLYTLFLGVEIYEARRWISVFGQSFQPSDLGKVALIVFLAKMLTQKQEVIRDFKKGFLPIISWVLIICLLIAPSDLSTAALIFLSSLALMFVAGVDLKYIGGLLLAGVLALVILFNTVERAKTWESRWGDYVASWTSDEYEPSDQIQQAYAAIASGGLFGKGFGKSTQKYILPSANADMIYAITIEELGLIIGGLGALILYMILLFRGIGIVTMSKTFGALLVAGLTFMLVFQAMMNIGVVVGLLPVTGLPSPMLSMGGTSILFTSFSLGIILSVSRDALGQK